MSNAKTIRETRKIFKRFLKTQEFSKFEKDQLLALKNYLIVAYNFGVPFYSYLQENGDRLEEFLDQLDNKSRAVVNSVIEDINFIHTHNLVEAHEQLFNQEEEILNFLKKIKNFDNLKLPTPIYEQSVFDYKLGLEFLSKETLGLLENKDFIDGGAYIGDSPLVFEHFYSPRNIYAFEPETENYNNMLKTIELNDLNTVVPIKKGIGDKADKLHVSAMTTISSVSENKNDPTVKFTTIDKFCAERELSVGLIKLDVEGYELNVLAGAKNTIKEFSPILLISIYHNPEQFLNTVDLIRDFNPSYNIIVRKLSDLIPVLETFLIAWPE